MKIKILSGLIFIIAFSILLSGCGQKAAQTAPQSPASSAQQATSDNTPKTTPTTPDKTPMSPEEAKFIGTCGSYPDKLDACESFSCKFTHILTGELMERKIIGIEGGKCHYTEQMPNNGLMDCKYSESFRKAIAQSYRDFIASGGNAETEVTMDESGKTQTKYTIDGKEVESPLQEAM